MEKNEPDNLLSAAMARLGSPAAHPAAQPAGPGASYVAGAPLQTATAAQLRAGFVENLHALFRAMAGLPGGESVETPTVALHHAFPGNPMFKGIWRARFDEARADTDLDAEIEGALDWFRARNAPFAFWWCDESTQPPTLPARLYQHGLVAWEEGAPGMAVDLATLRYDLIDRTPPGFVMERVRDAAGLQDFCTAFVAGMEVPRWAGEAWVEATLAAGIERAPWRCYVGRLHGEPVASNMLFCGAGVASVFGVATVPAARRQGIGAAITLLPYQHAQAEGYRYGVLFATELGAPVYRRMGFRDVGSTISRYLWRA